MWIPARRCVNVVVVPPTAEIDSVSPRGGLKMELVCTVAAMGVPFSGLVSRIGGISADLRKGAA
jgi:hypothetical protein